MLDSLPEEQAAALRKKFEAFVEEASKAIKAQKQSCEEDNLRGLKRWPDGRVTVPKGMVADLVELGKAAAEEHAFKPGDIVQWKRGLENRDLGESGIAVVTQVLAKPRTKLPLNPKDKGHEVEVLDIVVGILFESEKMGDVFLELHTEKRRLEPADPADADAPYAVKLKAKFAELEERGNVFQKGDIVVWKEGLANKVLPSFDMPSIVMEVKDTPMYCDEPDTGSPYFCEPIDLIVLTEIDEDKGKTLMVGVDSRRMRIVYN